MDPLGYWLKGYGDKLLFKVKTQEHDTIFEPISVLKPLADITKDISSKMSIDSIVTWKYLYAVMKGKVNSGVVTLKYKCKWLIGGKTCLLLYINNNNLASVHT